MLELKNISFSVNTDGTEKEIIHNLSLTVEDQKFVVITGPNGGGKSSLAKLIAGVEKPTSGSIFLDGKDITGLSITERAQAGIAFAFQQPVRFKGTATAPRSARNARSPFLTDRRYDRLRRRATRRS